MRSYILLSYQTDAQAADGKAISLAVGFPRKCLSGAGVGANHFRQHPSPSCQKLIYMEPKADCVWQDIGENGQRERSGASFSVTSTGFLRCSLSEVSEQGSDRGYKGDPLDEGIEQTKILNANQKTSLLNISNKKPAVTS